MGNTLGIIVKLHPSGFDAQNATIQYKVTQPLGPGYRSATVITDDTGFGVFQTNITDDGNLYVVVGSTRYNGTWTPTPGGDLLVHYFTEGGVPRLFLNNVEVTLVVDGVDAGFVFMNLSLIGGEISTPNQKMTYDFIFVATAPLPPTVVFCCPDGVPSR